IRVPLIVAGPGVPRGRLVTQVTQNTDLYPTFVQLAGGQSRKPIDGHSLVSLLHPAKTATAWRTVALVEHVHTNRKNPGDPDTEDGASPTTYEAIRIVSPHLSGFRGPVNSVYVEYADAAHELEYYNLDRDPFELDNTDRGLTGAQQRELHRILLRLKRCHGT